MKALLYTMTAVFCALFLAAALWVPATPVEADPPVDHVTPRGHSTALVLPGNLAGTCSITCSDGDTTETVAENAGDCACDCADYCGGTCTASGGGQVATCSPS